MHYPASTQILTTCRTAKVWKNFTLTYDLKGHQQSVWAVLAVDDDRFLTGTLTTHNVVNNLTSFLCAGSADKTIKLWEKHKAVQTFNGHQDAVRGLALVPDIGFASCSNDR